MAGGISSGIALYGGTFDPFHLGHLSIVRAARDELPISEVVVMPAFVSPFKQDRAATPARDRVAMARLAVRGMAGVRVSTWEIERARVSYTYETLCDLRSERGCGITFLVGTDSLLELPTWYRGPDILREFPVAVAPRPGTPETLLTQKIEEYRSAYGACVLVLHNERVPVSSSGIRAAVRRGEDISGFVPAEVEAYIYEHRLYQNVPEGASV